MKTLLTITTILFFSFSVATGIGAHAILDAKTESQQGTVITARLLSLSLLQLSEEDI